MVVTHYQETHTVGRSARTHTSYVLTPHGHNSQPQQTRARGNPTHGIYHLGDPPAYPPPSPILHCLLLLHQIKSIGIDRWLGVGGEGSLLIPHADASPPHITRLRRFGFFPDFFPSSRSLGVCACCCVAFAYSGPVSSQRAKTDAMSARERFWCQ